MTIPTFAAPPHPQSVLRYLHTSRRNYAATANAAGGADIPTIANQAASAALAVSGTIYRAPGVHMPLTVSVGIRQGTLKGAVTANVNQGTGAFSATIAGGSGSAGAATVEVTGAGPVFTTSSNSFTLS